MSSGIDADIALDAAVVLSLGMNRVLGHGAGLAGRGAEALAALAAGRAEARAAALAEVETHERALREAVERNARIAALAGTRAKIGADVAVPDALDLADRSPEELTAWCAATDPVLDEAERRLSEHLAAQVSTQIFEVPAGGLQTGTGRDAPPPPREDVQEHLERIMARLLPDAGEAERRAVVEAARLLAGIGTPEEAEDVLQEVRLRIQAANDRVRERRDEERRRAAERDAAEQAEAERRYVLGSITAAFEDMGYEVQAGFETLTAEDGTVTLTKGAWPDHSVRMRVDDAHVRASMVRERPAESEDDRRLDVEREREWCEAFEAARARLADAGIRSDVAWRLDPGVRELPVSEGARQTRGRTGQRERSRERHK
ncbi:response regulator receiver protein [Actinomadura madurae]|uniref:response regulator receiver protein n=1 Tax=Actinomadura madurae TaxID=1993 RepID=UPI002026C57B|nr:response regulator receiver protein [Actinomadura madurae]MCP9950208.1 response regulator receiver protein [Actinomadura madurae]MCP9979447.1 response regulator receiver protein [Actinomadura madurae]MCQ0009022.1 response regulator receiver protein [Actinomadura madurae]MCQ0015658.1 response regulator receiver protein [Actinomadura madurae]URN06463.1 response regulator receiver protein [Actinomadura madurae]